MRVFDEKRPFYQFKSAMKGKLFLVMAENNCRNTLQGFFKSIKNFFKKMKNFLKNLLMFWWKLFDESFGASWRIDQRVKTH